jgi:hypothetical protein
MMMWQKIVLFTAVAVAVCALIEEARVARANTQRIQSLEANVPAWKAQIRRLTVQRDATLAETARLARTNADNASQEAAHDPMIQTLLARIAALKEVFDRVPDERIPEMRLLTDDDWIATAEAANPLESLVDFRTALSALRRAAKSHVAGLLGAALSDYITNSKGKWPVDLRQILKGFSPQFPDDILQRYEVIEPGPVWVRDSEIFIREKDDLAVDRQYDQMAVIGPRFSDLWLAPGWTPSPSPR